MLEYFEISCSTSRSGIVLEHGGLGIILDPGQLGIFSEQSQNIHWISFAISKDTRA